MLEAEEGAASKACLLVDTTVKRATNCFLLGPEAVFTRETHSWFCKTVAEEILGPRGKPLLLFCHTVTTHRAGFSQPWPEKFPFKASKQQLARV